ncbi:MAG: FtsX-like permease family protein [Saprospiraceae bacterium]|nr:ABC transporter permease [Saprospiraceae bacterium]
MFLKLAWRNLWRNKRRTIISISSVLFAVLFASVISSFQKGTWDHMVDNVVRYYLGYVQIHHKGFWDDRTLENSFEPEAVPASLKSEMAMAPRLESFALASSGEVTRGVLVAGIDPVKEDEMTGLKGRLTAGQYLSMEDTAVLLAEGLGQLLNLGVGDTLIMVSQGYQGRNAAGAYPVKGLVKFGSPELNKQLVLLPLLLARDFYGTGERLTSLAVNLPGREALPEALKILNTELPKDEFEVMGYKQLMPELIEAQELDTAGAMLILWVLYLLIGFGLFGTILMMTRERTYEFGVLTAIGTRHQTLMGMLWSEAMMIGIAGAIAGILVSLPIVWYLHTYPIQLTGNMAKAYENYGMEPVVKSAFELWIFVKQAIVIFIISTVLTVYPLWYIWRLKPVEAMRE